MLNETKTIFKLNSKFDGPAQAYLDVISNTLSLPALMKLLGHSNIAMTLRYAGVSQEDLRREYFKAMEKINSIDLLSEQPESGKKDGKENILEGIDDIITRLQSFRKDSQEGKRKKKIQRIAERLRRAYQDIEHTFKGV